MTARPVASRVAPLIAPSILAADFARLGEEVAPDADGGYRGVIAALRAELDPVRQERAA